MLETKIVCNKELNEGKKNDTLKRRNRSLARLLKESREDIRTPSKSTIGKWSSQHALETKYYQLLLYTLEPKVYQQ